MSNAIRRWARALAALGVRSASAFDDGDPVDTGDVEWIRVPHLTVGGRRIPSNLGRVLDGFDLLVLHGAWAAHNVVAGRTSRGAHIPYLLEPRGAYDPHIVARRPALKRAWWVAFGRELVAGARGMHLFFEAERGHLARLGYGGPFVVAPNGVDTPDAPAWDGGSGGFVLWYGRFDVEHKGIDLLVDGLALVPASRRPLLRLHGPDRRGSTARIAARVSALGLSKWVAVGGPVYGAQKEELLSRCLGFAYPSRWEGFGIAPAEAVARGVPLLATPYPLAMHLAERGGAVVVPAHAAGLASGLEQLLAADAGAIAAVGNRIIRDEFRWDDVARSWLDQVTALL
jgi:glycosyltransferase involved in cell wall biosynthesis